MAVSVADGFLSERLPHLFRKFVRSGRKSSRRGVGAGHEPTVLARAKADALAGKSKGRPALSCSGRAPVLTRNVT